MRAGSVISGKYVGVGSGGILHTLNYDAHSSKATMFGSRVTLNLLGDGYIESVPDDDLKKIAREQPQLSRGKVHGQIVYVTSGSNLNRRKVIGRFGWKAQHGALLDASADALLNELGVPNRIFPGIVGASNDSHPKLSHPVANAHNKLDEMVGFVRASEPVAPDSARSTTVESQTGSQIFDKIGCSLCHVRTFKTAPPGTHIVSTNVVVSERLGNKEIHPFSDFLLHDIGTGDGIVQNVRPEDYAESTANKFRTASLWGLRYRLWMMHDGQTITYNQAIMRHRGEALDTTMNYAHLSSAEKEELIRFLDSL